MLCAVCGVEPLVLSWPGAVGHAGIRSAEQCTARGSSFVTYKHFYFQAAVYCQVTFYNTLTKTRSASEEIAEQEYPQRRSG